MDILFVRTNLKKLCNSDKRLKKKYGSQCAKEIRERLDELRDFPTLHDLRSIPMPQCHELTGDKKGYLAVKAGKSNRIILKPPNSTPRKQDGGLDWKRVTQITVAKIEDYHD